MNPYANAAEILIRESGVTVRKWRSSSTGTAYYRDDDWGIEAPEPRGPISFGTFAHEVGHQMLHRATGKPRWLQEVEAWDYALKQARRFKLTGIEKIEADAAKALDYSLAKAIRRGADPDAIKATLWGGWWPRAVGPSTTAAVRARIESAA